MEWVLRARDAWHDGESPARVTALLDAVLAEMAAVGIRELFLEVRVSNRGARRLYEAYGFERIGLREGYYSRPREDALVLRRRIGSARGD